MVLQLGMHNAREWPAAELQMVWAHDLVNGYGRDAQHSAISLVASQDLGKVAWTTPVDLAPQYTPSGGLLTHYGSPLVTTTNTVILPVKTGSLNVTSGSPVPAPPGSGRL